MEYVNSKNGKLVSTPSMRGRNGPKPRARSSNHLTRIRANSGRMLVIAIILFVLSLIFLIAGIVMLGIGVHKASKKTPSCSPRDCPTMAPICQKVESLMHFSIDPGLAWNEDFSDPKSSATKMATEQFKANVSSILNSVSFVNQKFTDLIGRPGFALNVATDDIWPDTLIPSPKLTTIFYGTFLFGEPVNTEDVQNALKTANLDSTIEENSQGFCQNMGDQPTPTLPPWGGFPCDPRTPPRTVIIMIDSSQPVDPSIDFDQKLSYLRNYLKSVSPQSASSWNQLEMGIGVFYGSNAFLINNWLCTNQSCWDSQIAQLFINSTSQSHNATRAFEFIRDEFMNPSLQLRPGRARSLTIIADGFEYDGGFGEKWCKELAQVVSESFYLATIVISPSQAIQSTYSSLLMSEYRAVPLDYWDQLQDPVVLSRQLSWICQASPLTTPPPIPPTSAWIPIKFTTTPNTNPLVLENFCQDPADIVLLLSMPSQAELFMMVKQFLSDTLLQVFAGLDYGSPEKITRFALYTYFGANVSLVQNLVSSGGVQDMITTINGLQYIPHNDQSDSLSLAYKQSWDQFAGFGRSYASWSTLVITERLSENDADDAANQKESLNENGVFTFGIGTSASSSHYGGLNQIWNNYTLIDGSDLEPTNGATANKTANFARDAICAHYSGEGKPTVSTDAPNPTGSNVQPGVLPQGPFGPQQFPDIVIVLDTSANLTARNSALNDRGFEVIRIFLVNTLIKYKIGDEFTKVALVTFDGTVKLVFLFKDHNDWPSLYKALTEDWQYGPSTERKPQKAIDDAMAVLLNEVYQPTNGARKKANFLWLFTTGPENLVTANKYQAMLNQLGQGEVIVWGIGLGNSDDNFMSTISNNYLLAPNYLDPLTGLASQQDLYGPLLFQKSTSQRDQPPPIPKMRSDVVLAVDREMADGQLVTTKEFLTNFAQTFTISETQSRFALIVFDSTGIYNIIFMKDQLDKDVLLNNIASIQPKPQTSSSRNADYQLALDQIVKNISTEENGKRDSVSSFTIFITANGNNNYVIPSPNEKDALNATYTSQVLSISLDPVATFARKLASQEQYAYYVANDLLDWSIPTTGQRTPMQAFFADLQTENLNSLQNKTLATEDVSADFTVVLDLANLQENFDIVQNYLKTFVEKFSIGVFNVQVSGLSFGDVIVDSFVFSTCQNLTCVQDQINGWQNPDQQNSSYLVSVLNEVNDKQLVTSSGWRQSKSYVLIFTAQDNITWTTTSMEQIRNRLHNKNAFLYYLDMANGALPNNYRYLFDSYEELESPNELINGSAIDQAVVATLTDDYQAFRYPPPLSLSQIIADFVFVIDASSAGIFNQVRDLVINLISGMTIAPANATISIVTYTEIGVIDDSSFLLNQHETQADLTEAITKMTVPRQTASTGFGDPLDYLDSTVLQSANGYRSKAAFVTFFNANPNFTTSINSYASTIDKLQARVNVNFYAFDMAKDDTDDLVYFALARVIPKVMSATQIVRTLTVEPDAGVISGGNGYISFITDAYGSFIDQATTIMPTTTTTTTTTASTTTYFPTTSASLATIMTDIVFVLDVSAAAQDFFDDYIKFVEAFATPFTIALKSTRTAVMPVYEFGVFDNPFYFMDDMQELMDFLTDVKTYMNDFDTNEQVLGLVLRYVLKYLTDPANGYRPEIRNHWIIYLTSANNIDVIYDAIEKANMLKKDYYAFAGISYGNESMDRDTLQQVTGGSSCTFLPDSLDALVTTVAQNLQQKIFDNDGTFCTQQNEITTTTQQSPSTTTVPTATTIITTQTTSTMPTTTSTMPTTTSTMPTTTSTMPTRTSTMPTTTSTMPTTTSTMNTTASTMPTATSTMPTATSTMPTTTPTMASTPIPTVNLLADIVFLIDTSMSAQNAFDQYIEFVMKFTSNFTISQNWTRVAIVTVPGDPGRCLVTTSLDQLNNSQELIDALNDTKLNHNDFAVLGQYTDIALGQTNISMGFTGYRAEIDRHWIIYLTSADSITDADYAISAAHDAKHDYSIAAVIYGNGTMNQSLVEPIAGGPTCAFWTQYPDNLLSTIAQNLQGQLFSDDGSYCREQYVTTQSTSTPTETMSTSAEPTTVLAPISQADIVFLIDMSSVAGPWMNLTYTFIDKLLEQMQIGPPWVRLGIVPVSDGLMAEGQLLDETTNKTDFEQRLSTFLSTPAQTADQRIDRAFQMVSDQFLDEQGGYRPTIANHWLIYITFNNDTTWYSNATLRADELKSQYLYSIIGITFHTDQSVKEQMQQISGGESCSFNAISIDDMMQNVTAGVFQLLYPGGPTICTGLGRIPTTTTESTSTFPMPTT